MLCLGGSSSSAESNIFVNQVFSFLIWSFELLCQSKIGLGGSFLSKEVLCARFEEVIYWDWMRLCVRSWELKESLDGFLQAFSWSEILWGVYISQRECRIKMILDLGAFLCLLWSFGDVNLDKATVHQGLRWIFRLPWPLIQMLKRSILTLRSFRVSESLPWS